MENEHSTRRNNVLKYACAAEEQGYFGFQRAAERLDECLMSTRYEEHHVGHVQVGTEDLHIQCRHPAAATATTDKVTPTPRWRSSTYHI